MDRPLDQLASLFEDGTVGAVAVINGDQQLVGIVSYVDALRGLTSRVDASHR